MAKQKETTITVEALKPRNQSLHDVLSGRKGGRMLDRKKDFNRAREKGRGRGRDSDC